jgi:mycothiol synthase
LIVCYCRDMFLTRAFNPAIDFPALVTLLNDAAKADSGTPTTETEQRDLKETFEKYGHFRQWVTPHPQAQGVMIAYTTLFKQPATPYGEFLLIVHPEFRNQGLEKQLLKQIIAEAKTLQSQYLYDLVDVNNKQRQAFVESQGFKPERGFRLMTTKLSRALPTLKIPGHLYLRTYKEVNDVEIIVEIMNRGCSDLPGHKVAERDNVDWISRQPQDGIFLLFDKHNKVVGCVSALVTEDGRGQIDAPALIPEYRNPELYLVLVLVGLEYLAKQDCEEVNMNSWGDYESTIAAYTELGFKTVVHELGYRLDLS